MLLQHYHILPVIQFCRILAREGAILVKNIGYFWIFCILMIRNYVIWPICGLTNQLLRNKTTKISIMMPFWWRHQITSPKIVSKMTSQKFPFSSPPPLSKILVAPLAPSMVSNLIRSHFCWIPEADLSLWRSVFCFRCEILVHD